MCLFRKLFKSGKECPRCLGKGFVDENDIVRLGMELMWTPGKCAYCSGKGRVDLDMDKKLPVDTAYLTTDLPKTDRNKLIRGDLDALEQAYKYTKHIDIIISQICYLHFTCHLDTKQIAGLFILATPEEEKSEREMDEHIKYIDRVIQNRIQKN